MRRPVPDVAEAVRADDRARPGGRSARRRGNRRARRRWGGGRSPRRPPRPRRRTPRPRSPCARRRGRRRTRSRRRPRRRPARASPTGRDERAAGDTGLRPRCRAEHGRATGRGRAADARRRRRACRRRAPRRKREGPPRGCRPPRPPGARRPPRRGRDGPAASRPATPVRRPARTASRGRRRRRRRRRAKSRRAERRDAAARPSPGSGASSGPRRLGSGLLRYGFLVGAGPGAGFAGALGGRAVAGGLRRGNGHGRVEHLQNLVGDVDGIVGVDQAGLELVEDERVALLLADLIDHRKDAPLELGELLLLRGLELTIGVVLEALEGDRLLLVRLLERVALVLGQGRRPDRRASAPCREAPSGACRPRPSSGR